MSKVFAVSEIDAQQTIDRFVSENFPESYAIFSQYGNRSQTKTERFTTVPFMTVSYTHLKDFSFSKNSILPP